MGDPIVETRQPVTLVGGGHAQVADVLTAVDVAPVLVAADGGAALALKAGHTPVAVIGDLDSLDQADRARLPPDRLHRIDEQDSTDFDKALRHIVSPAVLAVGFLGARLDHQLAALNTLVARADRPCILLGEDEIVFHAPTRLEVATAPGDVVSLFPMAEVTGRSQGLQWEIDGLRMAPWARVGTSNRATGPVTLETDGPGLLVILPRRLLAPVLRSVSHGRRGPGHGPPPVRA